ncbi:MAG: NAD(P)H-dependent oxidoreductase [Asgard group archaeon]|nr:NAD(P)H-dependent oxidoreductase [Asgard group archaeon]
MEKKQMKIVVLFAHPNENSYGAALKKAFIQGAQKANHEIKQQALYQEAFNPVMSKKELLGKKRPSADPQVRQYQEELLWGDIVVIIHPAWWYGAPAILKGYLDRVLEKGKLYEYKKEKAVGKIENTRGVLIQTFDCKEEDEKEKFNYVTARGIIAGFKYCGIKKWLYKPYFRIMNTTKKQREKWLKEIETVGEEIEEKIKKPNWKKYKK